MTKILAHLLLFGRHRTTVRVGGLYWTYCNHRSHALDLRCWRWEFADGQCIRHNNTCWFACPPDPDDPFAVDIYETDQEDAF